MSFAADKNDVVRIGITDSSADCLSSAGYNIVSLSVFPGEHFPGRNLFKGRDKKSFFNLLQYLFR